MHPVHRPRGLIRQAKCGVLGENFGTKAGGTFDRRLPFPYRRQPQAQHIRLVMPRFTQLRRIIGDVQLARSDTIKVLDCVPEPLNCNTRVLQQSFQRSIRQS